MQSLGKGAGMANTFLLQALFSFVTTVRMQARFSLSKLTTVPTLPGAGILARQRLHDIMCYLGAVLAAASSSPCVALLLQGSVEEFLRAPLSGNAKPSNSKPEEMFVPKAYL